MLYNTVAMTNSIQIGGSEMVVEFVKELEASPEEIEYVCIASPFMKLDKNAFFNRVLNVLLIIKKNGGAVKIVSEVSKQRIETFRKIIKQNPDLYDVLMLSDKLHAKFGYLRMKNGAAIAFMGSANVTDAAVHKNNEIVLLVKNISLATSACWDVYYGIEKKGSNIKFEAIDKYVSGPRKKRRVS